LVFFLGCLGLVCRDTSLHSPSSFQPMPAFLEPRTTDSSFYCSRLQEEGSRPVPLSVIVFGWTTFFAPLDSSTTTCALRVFFIFTPSVFLANLSCKNPVPFLAPLGSLFSWQCSEASPICSIKFFFPPPSSHVDRESSPLPRFFFSDQPRPGPSWRGPNPVSLVVSPRRIRCSPDPFTNPSIYFHPASSLTRRPNPCLRSYFFFSPQTIPQKKTPFPDRAHSGDERYSSFSPF